MVIGAERFGVRPRGKEQHGPRHRRRQRSTGSTLLVASALDVTPIQPPRISAVDRTDFAGGGHEPDRAILESALDGSRQPRPSASGKRSDVCRVSPDPVPGWHYGVRGAVAGKTAAPSETHRAPPP